MTNKLEVFMEHLHHLSAAIEHVSHDYENSIYN